MFPSRIYRALSRRSLGRYILATSSLVGECTRVYAPEPLGLIASSLCSRFITAWDSKGRDRRASLGHQKSSAFSYDKFMSHDPTADDEDLVGGGDPSSPAVPPNKYGRVSSAFLTRHEIGGLTTNISPTESGGECTKEKTHTVVPRGAELDAGSRTPPTSKADARSRRPSTAGNIRAFGQQAKARSVFKSLAGLGRDRTSGGGDDLDLLSDSGEGVGEWDEDLAGSRSDVPTTSKISVAAADAAGGVHSEPTVRRNLVGLDEDSTALVEKLRLGKKTERSRRKRRQSRPSSRNAKR